MANSKEIIQSVDHAFLMVAELLRKPRQTANELSKALGFSRTAVYRLLWTLAEHGAVIANEKREYSLGPFFFNPGIGRVIESSLVDISLPALYRLRSQTSETVGIYAARAMEIVNVERLESPYEIRRITSPGDSLPLTRGAVGKCYLAWRLTEVENQSNFLGSIGIGPKQLKHWQETLAKIRNDGFAVSWEERVPGGASVSAPVFNSQGRILAVVSVSGPMGRITPEKVGSISQMVCSAAREVETQLQVSEKKVSERGYS